MLELGFEIGAVWDVDDIMWRQNERAAETCGIPFEKLVDFHVNENPLLTAEEKQALNACYANPNHFLAIPWGVGLARIPDLVNYGVRSRINSNTFSAEGRDNKITSLRVQIPRLDELNQHYGLVNDKTTVQKPFDKNDLILIDDSPYNVAKFPGPIIVTPMTPWIVTEKAQGLLRGKEVHYFTYGYPEEAIEIVKLLAIRLFNERLRRMR